MGLFLFCVCVCVCVCVMPFILISDRCEFRHGSTCIEDVCSQTSFTRPFSVVCVFVLCFSFLLLLYLFFSCFYCPFIIHLIMAEARSKRGVLTLVFIIQFLREPLLLSCFVLFLFLFFFVFTFLLCFQ